MIAGRLTYRLRLVEPVVTVDSFKAERTTWQPRGVIRAERVSARGYRHEEAAEHFSDSRAEFNIRSVHAVRENWRVEEVGGYTYTVTAVIDNRRRGMKTLVCERLNT